MKPVPPPSQRRGRIVERPGDPTVLRLGLPVRPWRDLYHRALGWRWWWFLLLGAGLYLIGNVVFALLYLAQPGAIAQARPGSFADAFFFSVQTLSTIGYGALTPATLYANLVVTAETLFGLLSLAIVTGLLFARISRPTARVMFSHVAVVTTYDGELMLMLRMANERRNRILQADVTVAVLRDERTREGGEMRRFHDLHLARSRSPVFAMTFTVMHPLDERSPLHGMTRESLVRDGAEIVVSVTGLDETMTQTVHARWSYLPHEILFGHRFADVITVTTDGRRAIDFRRFHETIPA